MVRTFFIIFMFMEKGMNLIHQLHQEMVGSQLGDDTNVFVRDYQLVGITYVLYLEVPYAWVGEHMFQEAMAAYYSIMAPHADQEEYRIASIIFTGGLKDTHQGVNILDAHLNLMPAYVRHNFTLPHSISDVKDFVESDAFKLNAATVAQLKKFFAAVVPQQAVLKKSELMLKLLKRNKFTTKSRISDDMITINYTLPEDSMIHIEVDPNNHYRLHPVLKFDPTRVLFTVADQDRESFLAMEEKDTQGFLSDVIHRFVALVNKYGFKVSHDQVDQLRSSLKLN